MFNKFFGTLAGLIAVLALAAPGDAAAQSTWNLGTVCDPTPVQSTYVVGGNTTTCATGVPAETMTATAYANIGSGGTFLRASMGDFNTAGIGIYSGSGDSSTDGQHAFDNITTSCNGGVGTQGAGANACGGSQEFLLVNFGPYKVNLSSLAIGYRNGDADVAVLRWDGADKTAAEMAAIVGAKTTATLHDSVVAAGGVGTGWSLVATESMNDAIPDVSSVNLGNKVSSWWIISTYYGTTATTTAGTLTTGDDRFKLATLTGNVCINGVTGGNGGNGGTCNAGNGGGSVSEPGSLALAGLAFVGAFASRRRVAAALVKSA